MESHGHAADNLGTITHSIPYIWQFNTCGTSITRTATSYPSTATSNHKKF
eukprot:c35755_g1_i1 orf=6-155(-)